MLFLHQLVICPKDITSNGTRKTKYPFFSKSNDSCVYVFSFLLCALSALLGREQVSSNNAIVFVSLFTNTKSGFEPTPADT